MGLYQGNPESQFNPAPGRFRLRVLMYPLCRWSATLLSEKIISPGIFVAGDSGAYITTLYYLIWYLLLMKMI
jgi:hypothetical protein